MSYCRNNGETVTDYIFSPLPASAMIMFGFPCRCSSLTQLLARVRESALVMSNTMMAAAAPLLMHEWSETRHEPMHKDIRGIFSLHLQTCSTSVPMSGIALVQQCPCALSILSCGDCLPACVPSFWSARRTKSQTSRSALAGSWSERRLPQSMPAVWAMHVGIWRAMHMPPRPSKVPDNQRTAP